MKKCIITLALALMLMLCATIPCLAVGEITSPGSGNAELTYTVASTYSVTIPESAITVSKANEYASLGTVKVAAGMLLDVGKTLTVKLHSTNAAGDTFNLVLTGDTNTKVTYSIQKDGASVTAASSSETATEILTVAAGTTAEQTAALTYMITGTAIKSGSFTDTLTFTVAIE